jgi:hypothetical protein
MSDGKYNHCAGGTACAGAFPAGRTHSKSRTEPITGQQVRNENRAGVTGRYGPPLFVGFDDTAQRHKAASKETGALGWLLNTFAPRSLFVPLDWLK